MSHTYEVFVDILEMEDASAMDSAMMTERYEVSAESRQSANKVARSKAQSDHPTGIEFDVRVTRAIH